MLDQNTLNEMNVFFSFFKWSDDQDLYKIYIPLCVTIAMLGYILMLCEPGHYCTEKFENFEYELGQCDWYALPIELQRMYLIFLSNTQNEVEITSYGGIPCKRDKAKKVLAIASVRKMSLFFLK